MNVSSVLNFQVQYLKLHNVLQLLFVGNRSCLLDLPYSFSLIWSICSMCGKEEGDRKDRVFQNTYYFPEPLLSICTRCISFISCPNMWGLCFIYRALKGPQREQKSRHACWLKQMGNNNTFSLWLSSFYSPNKMRKHVFEWNYLESD